MTDGTKEERDLVASIPKGIQESEIHNHYEKDSHCQVFNGKVEGQFK